MDKSKIEIEDGSAFAVMKNLITKDYIKLPMAILSLYALRQALRIVFKQSSFLIFTYLLSL